MKDQLKKIRDTKQCIHHFKDCSEVTDAAFRKLEEITPKLVRTYDFRLYATSQKGIYVEIDVYKEGEYVSQFDFSIDPFGRLMHKSPGGEEKWSSL